MTTGPLLHVETVASPTVAIGAWIRSGSAHEPDELAGVTHLLEHLLLRRCGERAPDAIAEQIDSLGGAVDAFTTRETCAITAHVPAERFQEALDLVLDAVFRPTPRVADVELEQRVIEAEFDLVQDSPAEVAAERALEACWGAHPLARPVLGSREVVRRLDLRQLKAFHHKRFILGSLLLVAVGPIDRAPFEAALEGLPIGTRPTPPSAPSWSPAFLVDERDGLEQLYANLVLPGLPADDREAMTLAVLHQLLGAGASSRLFRELRERLGLVYEVESGIYSATSAGVLDITFSCPVRQADRCWAAVLRILEQVAAGQIADREVSLARQALTSGLVLGAEGVDALMENHAGELLTHGRRFDPAVLRAELDDVGPDRVRALAARLVDLDLLAGAVCGPPKGPRLPRLLAGRRR